VVVGDGVLRRGLLGRPAHPQALDRRDLAEQLVAVATAARRSNPSSPT
jgi:hypothetical protein